MQRMDRLRRSLRDSFRRKRDAPESSKPHQWQADEEAVRSGNCTFNVKYLGCVEVFESRGMQVCEEAMKVLRQSRRRPVKSLLYVSGDGLRVVEDDTKGLIVDQTIEKVSFCAPDRNHERGFSYICRDGTTRRWMCHGFLATKDSGERLSHAVGCAFAACLERKQKREKECGVSMTYDPKTSTFTRSGSFRVASITDSLSDKSKSPPPELDSMGMPIRTPVINTHAIERPHAPVKMLERQGSFRGFSQLANQSPFKRQLSLRLSDLPSNLQRTQQNNIDILTNNNIIPTTAPVIPPVTASPTPPPRTQRNRLHSLPNNSLVGVSSTSSTIAGSTIPENTTNGNGEACPPLKIENKDLVSELCQQVTQGLSLLAANHDDVKNNTSGDGTKFSAKFTNPWDEEVGIKSTTTSISKNPALPVFNTAALGTVNQLISSPSNVISSANPLSKQDSWLNNLSGAQPPKAPMPSKPSPTHIMNNINATANSSLPPLVSSIVTARNITVPATSSVSPTPPVNPSAPSTSIVPTNVSMTSEGHVFGPSPGVRPSLVSQSSVQQGPGLGIRSTYKGAPSRSQSLGSDPFDADWAAPVARTGQTPTNPFVRQQTFQVSM